MSGEANKLDDKYMYEFCTRRCTWKECPKDATCFDAHSKVMCRRVPKQIWSIGGLFNYIPEHCPQYKWKKKCCSGDNCFRAHGWLEVIFHPLLYKTKLCKSSHENGVCRLYGIYCAKAHKRSEMRNLAKIYGKNWKVHYDISKREVLQKFVGGLVGNAALNEERHLRVRGGWKLAPTSKYKELKHGGSNEVIDCLCGSNSLRSPIRSLTISESSGSLLSQISVRSPINFRTPPLEYPVEQVCDYTDLYKAKPVNKIYSSDEFRAKKESAALYKCQSTFGRVPSPGYPETVASNSRPSFSWEMDSVDDIERQEDCKHQLASTARNLFRWTGAERSFMSKLHKQPERRSKKEDFGDAM